MVIDFANKTESNQKINSILLSIQTFYNGLDLDYILLG